MKKIFLILLFLTLNINNSYSNNKLYDKIDLFGEVLEKIFLSILYLEDYLVAHTLAIDQILLKFLYF